MPVASRKNKEDKAKREIHRGAKPTGLGFHDTAIAALWRVEDEQAVNEEIRLIRANELPSWSFDKKLEKRFNDQRNVKFENGETFEPIEVTPPKDDLTTLLGMQHLAKLGVGQSLPTWTHYAAGTGIVAEKLTDDKLAAEIPGSRVSVLTDGYRQEEGPAMRFMGKFSTTVRSAIVTEGAMFTASSGGIPLFRTVFTEEDFITHRQYQTFFSLSQLIRMISVR